jgi:hypothetical protein
LGFPTEILSRTYLSHFRAPPTRTSVLVLIIGNNAGGILYEGVTVHSCQFLFQQHVQNHSKPYTILIFIKILAVLLLLYRTRPAISLLEYQFQAFQFPMHPPVYCLYQLNIPIDASHRTVPWLCSSILSSLVYTPCYTTQSTIHSIRTFYVTFNVISMQSS